MARPEYIISPMRVQTLPATTLFFIAGQPVPFAELDRDFDALLDRLASAIAQAQLAEVGPGITRYYRLDAGEPDRFLMEVGVPVPPGTPPTGGAQIQTLPPWPCAGVLLWGSLAHIVAAYAALQQAVAEAGVPLTGDNREYNYFFAGVDSPHNVIGLYLGIRPEPDGPPTTNDL